jgi:NAD(P)H-hydrate epimerase
MQERHVPLVALDIPSGVNGTTGEVEGTAVQATETLTLGAMKTGLLCMEGRERSACIHIADIGIPPSVQHDARLKTFAVEASDVHSILPVRALRAHKYNAGKVYVLAGSRGLTGAAAMTCEAALHIGAGAVVLGTPESVYPILAKKMTEVMVQPLPATNEGTLSGDAFDAIVKKAAWADVVVVGPGLSRNPETQLLLIKILLQFRGKCLLDADGLNALGDYGLDRFRTFRSECILTPHIGECSRLTGQSAREIEIHRIETARSLSSRLQATVVLKGVPTATAATTGEVYLNSTGNPGMATAGSGDVLSGVIAGLWAQGMTPQTAAYSGAFLHGLAGDLAVENKNSHVLVATDIIRYLSSAVVMTETSCEE